MTELAKMRLDRLVKLVGIEAAEIILLDDSILCASALAGGDWKLIRRILWWKWVLLWATIKIWFGWRP